MASGVEKARRSETAGRHRWLSDVDGHHVESAETPTRLESSGSNGEG
jgi:hypothetical protein